jgi:hypothetical protein
MSTQEGERENGIRENAVYMYERERGRETGGEREIEREWEDLECERERERERERKREKERESERERERERERESERRRCDHRDQSQLVRVLESFWFILTLIFLKIRFVLKLFALFNCAGFFNKDFGAKCEEKTLFFSV